MLSDRLAPFFVQRRHYLLAAAAQNPFRRGVSKLSIPLGRRDERSLDVRATATVG
jgi:hypothetical protein